MRWQKLLTGTHLIIFVAALCVLFVGMYLVAAHFHYRWDFTQGGVLGLSPQTLQVLQKLRGEEVTLYIFVPEDDPTRSGLNMLLDQYTYNHRKLRYEFIDPDRKPSLARRYNVRSYGTIVIEAGGNEARALKPTEEAITQALYKLTQEDVKPLYFTTGHGERSFDDTTHLGYSLFDGELKKENFALQPLLLIRSDVPDDCQALLIAGPKHDFADEEIKALRKYIDGGGHLLALIDPLPDEPLENLEKMLGYYGVLLRRDIIVDEMSVLFGSDYLVPIVTQYSRHDITKDFTLPCFLPLARSVSLVESTAADTKGRKLALSGQGSWAETDLRLLDEEGKVKYEEQSDIAGPVSLAVVVTGKAHEDEETFRIVVIGDSDFANNRYLLMYGNRDLALNSVNWLAGEETLVSIRPRVSPSSPLLMNEFKQRMVFLGSVVALPLVTLLFGSVVLLARKRFS